MNSNPGAQPASLTVDQATQIARQARRVKYSIPYGGDPRAGAPLGRAPSGLPLIPAIVTSPISAASGTTYGTGSAQLYEVEDGDSTATAYESDIEGGSIGVANWYQNSGTIANGTHIFVTPWSGLYWFVGGDC
jgi:hypothetical protein